MSKSINLREATKVDWVHTPTDPKQEYPGDNQH